MAAPHLTNRVNPRDVPLLWQEGILKQQICNMFLYWDAQQKTKQSVKERVAAYEKAKKRKLEIEEDEEDEENNPVSFENFDSEESDQEIWHGENEEDDEEDEDDDQGEGEEEEEEEEGGEEEDIHKAFSEPLSFPEDFHELALSTTSRRMGNPKKISQVRTKLIKNSSFNSNHITITMSITR